MKLLFITNAFPPYTLGGYDQLCDDVRVQLEREGHTIHVLTSNHRNDEGLPTEVRVTRTLHLMADLWHYRPLDFLSRDSANEKHNRRQVEDAINRVRPDLVVIWGMWNLSKSVAKRAEELMPDRVAYYFASYWPIDQDLHERFWSTEVKSTLLQLAKSALSAVAMWDYRRRGLPAQVALRRAACVSRFVKDELVSHGVVPVEPRVIYNGIHFEDFAAPPQEGPVEILELIVCSSLLASKGVHTAIEALSLLQARGQADRMRLTVVGSGHPDCEQHLRHLTAEGGLTDKVTFVGGVPRAEVANWLRQAHVFLFTSIWDEPLARSVMEAMAAGLAVIGTPVGGQREMLDDGQNALVFPIEDAEALAACILKLERDPAMRHALAIAGQAMVKERFTDDRMVREMAQWWQEIVDGCE